MLGQEKLIQHLSTFDTMLSQTAERNIPRMGIWLMGAVLRTTDVSDFG